MSHIVHITIAANNKPPERSSLRCAVTKKLLGRVDAVGVYVFCNACNTLHLLSYAEIAMLFDEAQSGAWRDVLVEGVHGK